MKTWKLAVFWAFLVIYGLFFIACDNGTNPKPDTGGTTTTKPSGGGGGGTFTYCYSFGKGFWKRLLEKAFGKGSFII